MKARILFSVFVFCLIISCEEKKSPQQQIVPEIIINEVSVSYDNCLPDSMNCTYVHIEYPEFSDSTKATLNEMIMEKLKINASSYFREEAIQGTIEHTAQTFIRDYEAFKIDFPEYKLGWYVQLYCEIIYESATIISFKIYSESFTGGAHPNSGTGFYIIDKSSLKALSIADVIADTTQFKKMLEEEFRHVKGIAKGQQFADKGYYLSDGDFLLNDNIGITDHSVIIHFNPYEIAPYALGATTLELDKSELAGVLQVD